MNDVRKIERLDATRSRVSKAKRVLVCGSRGWVDEPWVYEVLSELSQRDEIEVLHGGAEGADIFAFRACLDLGITAYSFLPDYKTHGKAAPHVRNDKMLDRADLVLAFWDGKSRGTKSVIEKARSRGIHVEVVRDELDTAALPLPPDPVSVSPGHPQERKPA